MATTTFKLDLNKMAQLGPGAKPRMGIVIGYFIVNDPLNQKDQATLDNFARYNDLSKIKEKATDLLPREEKENFLKTVLDMPEDELMKLMDFYCDCEFLQYTYLRSDGEPLVLVTDCTIGATHKACVRAADDAANEAKAGTVILDIKDIKTDNQQKYFFQMLRDRGLSVGEPHNGQVQVMLQRVADARVAILNGTFSFFVILRDSLIKYKTDDQDENDFSYSCVENEPYSENWQLPVLCDY